MLNTSALADTQTQADEIADAETDEVVPEVLFNEAISKQDVVASIGELKVREKCSSRQDNRRNAKTC